MARTQSPPILAQLRNARTHGDQSAALRTLKNEIVGHIQRKEAWIAHGALEPIVETLSSNRTSVKLNGKGSRLQLGSRQLSEEDGAKLQALQLLASFANGGPAFLPPLHASRALAAITGHISPYTNAPQIVVAALRALTDIADASALADPSSPLDIHTVADQVFAPQHLDSFNAILSISSSKHVLQSQVTLAAGLIQRLCHEEKQQNALASAGILDSLAARLASFAVREGYVLPGAPQAAQTDGIYEAFPAPAPVNAKLGAILDAITGVIGDSKYRATRLVLSPAILAVFPSVRADPLKSSTASRLGIGHGGFANVKAGGLTAMDYMLPHIPPSTSGNAATSNPQLWSGDYSSKSAVPSIWDATFKSATDIEIETSELESPLIPWLVHLVRSRTCYERLMAASVLASLYKAGLGSKSVREASLGLLVVPILVEMIAQNDKDRPTAGKTDPTMQRRILERAPAILARLIIDCEYLQKAAFDSGAVKTLTKLLRRSYAPVVSPNKPQYWSPHPDMDMDAEDDCHQLGHSGQDSELVHRIKVRESALKAIAALAAGKEDYRKALINEDFMGYVVESLSQYPKKPKAPAKDRSKEKSTADGSSDTAVAGYGQNPLSVIIAGCHLVRMLSRSVSIVRTAIVDYGLYLPILQFSRHADVQVQIAATATLANLVIEVSPVREPLMEKGVMRVLCEHAHSHNSALRLNALWALKHLVDAVGPHLKKECLEELEPGWLVQLIRDDAHDQAHYRLRAASGEDMDEDIETVVDEQIRWQYGVDGAFRELDASTSTRLRQAENRLAAIRESELNPARRARNDDVAIQEQGLDFIRNFIGRPGPGTMADTPNEAAELVDHLFSEVGQERLFEIMESKLRPRALSSFARRTSMTGRDTRIAYPQAQVIVPVIYILVHIAASDQRHKQLVVAQTELMKLLAGNALSKDREVRAALCQLVCNLTIRDDVNEIETRLQRAEELKKLGFKNKMEMLRSEDRDLDVRERAKQAVWHMEQALALPYIIQ